ncbi:hypothetical protein [Ornithinimicrobium kibberense]|uniref:hypothetical protein n=1 Tax=Ornithinimicrobium kibberense TaxID=282060 RepID=UPI00361EC88D
MRAGLSRSMRSRCACTSSSEVVSPAARASAIWTAVSRVRSRPASVVVVSLTGVLTPRRGSAARRSARPRGRGRWPGPARRSGWVAPRRGG